ncbi:MAG TPA: transglutaminase family protein [Pseudonocardia sp.]|nr:transglutaminase family protein [Pseudonocardia sp.]
MAIHVALEHQTSYQFDRPVRLGPHVVRLRPAAHCRTPVLSYSLRVEPETHFLNWQQDPFGNYLARLVFPEPTRELKITVDLVADLTVINPFDFFVDSSAERFPFQYDPELARDLAPYLIGEEPGPLLTEWLAELGTTPAEGMPVNDFLVGINQRLQGDIEYLTRMEVGVQTPEETLARRLGSCRDSAWLLVTILRKLGLAARFVSGYLVQLVADQKPLVGPAGPSEDFTDLHAWAEVYLPGAGWIGLDPTSGLFAGEGHLPLACTPEPATAAPVSGVLEPAEVEFSHVNRVRRVHESPRVTLPYSNAQWADIDALGHSVDTELEEGDVRLTQGGEPTFVSVADMESPEWTVAPDGPGKRALSWQLAGELAERFAPGGLLQFGQGKWYPGEPLPRWQIGVLWRTDEEPLWRAPELLADPWAPGDSSEADAERLMQAVAERLGIPAEYCQPAYEDPLDRLAAEALLPDGPPPAYDVDPTDPSLAEPDVRARIIAELDAERGHPAGWTIFVHRAHDGDGGWATTRWALRRKHLMLRPGDSPMGLRLPLSSMAWKPASPDPERSTFDPRDPLPTADELAARAGAGAVPAARVVASEQALPTALCVQRREGRLHVFLPPQEYLEHTLELLASVQEAVIEVGRPVVIEGYAPPNDPRLLRIVVGADPGVIEVNVHPSTSWAELVETVTGLYEDARRVGLGTEKFDLDGSHTGTGGGNHVTLGGASAPDSPLLRRPDLLRSMITFWQHHPALSYLFSGRFIGPTSQSPRVDEGRDETLYELEIAFDELERHGGGAHLSSAAASKPWLADRLLRHLLVDITGNTHRAEFCIDKLFSPGTERGRLGLLELRAFEMPPHPRMALVQALLVRALVARFWKEPYAGPLVRWGTELHDRFLLPAYVAADIAEVTADLRAHGYPFRQEWLAPFLEFRFPLIGVTEVAGVTLELRNAIEPWPVLGEEVALTTSARYVDSSVERLQVLVSGMTPGRHLVTCNGVPVPLRPTGTPGEFVAGVRYRAWAPHSALHPTIGVHAPLVFDLMDRWNGRSLGGCAYHVSHPGGTSYERFPVNANEAEARRASRFRTDRHTEGHVDLSALAALPTLATDEYPYTVDLRRAPGTANTGRVG